MSAALKSYLAAAKKSQRAFAAEIGVREATVSEWVNGKTPRAGHIQRIAEITDGAIPVTAWFSGVAANPEPSTTRGDCAETPILGDTAA